MNCQIQKYNILFNKAIFLPSRQCSLAKVDVNDYIIKQMKRKIEPFFIRNHKKKQPLNDLVPRHVASPPPRLESINRNSEATSVIRSEKQQRYNKIKSQTINFQPEKIRDSNFGSPTAQQRFENLRTKVETFISQQKERIKRKQFEATHNICENSSNQFTYHRSIITTLSQPFDYSKIQLEMKKNLQLYGNCEFLSRLSLQSNAIEKVGGKQKGKGSRKKTVKRRQNRENESPIVRKSSRGSKKTQFYSSRNRKSSLMLKDVEELQQLKQDRIDLQFQEGLVEEIYSTTRIKFRNKINQTKSRKNIYDGTLYFLKE